MASYTKGSDRGYHKDHTHDYVNAVGSTWQQRKRFQLSDRSRQFGDLRRYLDHPCTRQNEEERLRVEGWQRRMRGGDVMPAWCWKLLNEWLMAADARRRVLLTKPMSYQTPPTVYDDAARRMFAEPPKATVVDFGSRWRIVA